jgi:nitrous oxide reductase
MVIYRQSKFEKSKSLKKGPIRPQSRTHIGVNNDNAKMAKAGPCKAPSQLSVHIFSFKWLPLEPRQN